eukprot:3994551-Amphidinium_carterae.1
MCCVAATAAELEEGGVKRIGVMLAVVFMADLGLQTAALVVAQRITPLVLTLSDAGCFNFAVDREPERTLFSLFADLEKTVQLGVIQAVVAALGTLADFCGLFTKEKKMKKNAVVVAFVLSLGDMVLAIVDFTVLSVSAKEQADSVFSLLASGGPQMCIRAELSAEMSGNDVSKGAASTAVH